MAIVPGDPNAPVQPTLPKQLQPTMADFLQAAAIMDQKGRFKVAGDVTQFDPFPLYKYGTPENILKDLHTTKQIGAINQALGIGAKILPMTPQDKDK